MVCNHLGVLLCGFCGGQVKQLLPLQDNQVSEVSGVQWTRKLLGHFWILLHPCSHCTSAPFPAYATSFLSTRLRHRVNRVKGSCVVAE